MNQKECSAHPSFESTASSFSSFRSHSSHSPHRQDYLKERARIHFKCHGSFTHSFDGSQISSSSPAPSITSGYVSSSSDQVLGNSQSTNSKVITNNDTRPAKRLVLLRHPSLPDNEDNWAEIFSEMGDFTYSDFNQSIYVNLSISKCRKPVFI